MGGREHDPGHPQLGQELTVDRGSIDSGGSDRRIVRSGICSSLEGPGVGHLVEACRRWRTARALAAGSGRGPATRRSRELVWPMAMTTGPLARLGLVEPRSMAQATSCPVSGVRTSIIIGVQLRERLRPVAGASGQLPHDRHVPRSSAELVDVLGRDRLGSPVSPVTDLDVVRTLRSLDLLRLLTPRASSGSATRRRACSRFNSGGQGRPAEGSAVVEALAAVAAEACGGCEAWSLYSMPSATV